MRLEKIGHHFPILYCLSSKTHVISILQPFTHYRTESPRKGCGQHSDAKLQKNRRKILSIQIKVLTSQRQNDKRAQKTLAATTEDCPDGSAKQTASPIFNQIGVMLEWLKRHAWKACIRQKRIPSSNLGHSASKGLENQLIEH